LLRTQAAPQRIIASEGQERSDRRGTAHLHPDACSSITITAKVTAPDTAAAKWYRAERAAFALHSEIRHTVAVIRDGASNDLDLDLVRGMSHSYGWVRWYRPARPWSRRTTCACPWSRRTTCDEAVLDGESLPVDKDAVPVAAGTVLAGRAR